MKANVYSSVVQEQNISWWWNWRREILPWSN